MDDVVHGVRVHIDFVGCRLGLRDFIEVWEGNLDAITKTMIYAVGTMPGLGTFFRRSDGRQTKSAFCRAFVAARSAILEWDWANLLRIRRVQGRIFAERGVPLEEIVDVLFLFRETLVPYLLDAFGTDALRLRASLDATDRYVRLSLSSVIEAYMATNPIRMTGPVPLAASESDDRISCPAF